MRLELDLTQSELGSPHATRGQVTLGDQPHTSADGRGGSVAGEVGDGEDGVSSTPLPPALGVPIVTHSKGSKEGTMLYSTFVFLCLYHFTVLYMC